MINQRRAGAILSYIYIIINSLIVLVYIPIVKNTLGNSEFGLYQIAASIINYMSIMDLGFGDGIVVYTAKYHAAGKLEEEKKLHGMFAMIFRGIGLLAVLICIVLTFKVETIFGASMTAAELSKSKILMIILTVNVGLTFPLSIYGNIIVANEKFVFAKMISIVRAILNPLIMIPILVLGADSVSIVAVMTGVSIACMIANYLYCRIKLGISAKFFGFDKVIFREIFFYSAFVFLAEIVDKVNWTVDQIILGIVKGTEEVTIYSMASNYNQMILQLSTALSFVMLPKISKMVAKKEGDRAINREFIKTSRLQFLIIFMTVAGFIMFGHKFVMWHAGADCEKSYIIAVILILSFMIPLTQSIAISIVKAKNLFKFRALITLGMAMANVAISIPLAIRFGGVGSAIGTAVALIVANVIIINIYYQRRCGIDIKGYWKEIPAMALWYIPSIAICLALKFLLPLDGIYELLVYGALFVVLYSLTSYFAVMNTYEKSLTKKYMSKLFPFFRKT